MRRTSCSRLRRWGRRTSSSARRLARLRAQIVFARSRGGDAAPLLLAAARRLEPLDSGLARETYLEALGAVIFAGRLAGRHRSAGGGRGSPGRTAGTAATAVDRPPPGWRGDAVHRGLRAGTPPLRRALQAFEREAERGDGDIMRWLWLACPSRPNVAPSSGTTRHGVSWPRARSGSRAMPARSPSFPWPLLPRGRARARWGVRHGRSADRGGRRDRRRPETRPCGTPR